MRCVHSAIGRVTELLQAGTPLVPLGQPCPLRLSGFSSLGSSPARSAPRSRAGSASRRSRFPSRLPSCDILQEDSVPGEEEKAGLRSEGQEKDSEVDGEGLNLPVLEKVVEIIKEPEESWRRLSCSETVVGAELGEELQDGEETIGTVLEEGAGPGVGLVQPPAPADILSLFKVSSAARWKSVSSKITIDLSSEPTMLGTEENTKVGLAGVAAQQAVKSDCDTVQPTTVQQLLSVCWTVRPWDCTKDSRLFTSLFAAPWGVDCDEVGRRAYRTLLKKPQDAK